MAKIGPHYENEQPRPLPLVFFRVAYLSRQATQQPKPSHSISNPLLNRQHLRQVSQLGHPLPSLSQMAIALYPAEPQ